MSLRPNVLHESYGAPDILNEVLKAVPAAKRLAVHEIWEPQVLKSDAALALALEDMLDGVLRKNPILLIADDLEQQVLEKPVAGRSSVAPRSPEYRTILAAMLKAFRASRSRSRLLMTSRYEFRVPEDGKDLMAPVAVFKLSPMNERERRKQWSARFHLAGGLEQLEIDATSSADEVRAHLGRFFSVRDNALDAAAGNPGLQDLLTQPLLKGDAEIGTVEKAIEEIQAYRATGDGKAETEAVREFLSRMTIETYRAALTEAESRALAAAARSMGVDQAEAARERLSALGLLDDGGILFDHPHATANPLARPLVAPLSKDEVEQLATAVTPILAEIWRTPDGDPPQSALGAELARLALIGDVGAELLNSAAEDGADWLLHSRHDAPNAHDKIIKPTFERLKLRDAPPSAGLLMTAIDCAARVGDLPFQRDCLKRAETITDGSAFDRASLLLRSSDLKHQSGNPDGAIADAETARSLFQEAGIDRDAAIAAGRIADILEARGRLDEAEAIRREEELPVYERLGDIRSKAVTLGQIADILMARGRLDEAEAIRREERLPVYERLGDIRSKAVTQVKLADILATRGDPEAEALYARGASGVQGDIVEGMPHYVE